MSATSQRQSRRATPARNTKPRSNAAEVARSFMAQAAADGFQVQVSETGILTVSTSFSPRDKQAYSRADQLGAQLLGMVASTQAGNVWGTDGAGVGGHVACENGYYKLHKSGCNRLVLREIFTLTTIRNA